MSENAKTVIINPLPPAEYDEASYNTIDISHTQTGYTTLAPFKAWVQKVLPQVYDDALSYQELVYKMIWYLNTLIENTQIAEQNIQTINTAFGELQIYVNDSTQYTVGYVNGSYQYLIDYINEYFETVDIQGEINIKLDQMAQDGTLSNLIETYMNPYIETQNEQIALLTARVNNLTQTDSSTEGNSELLDIRVGYDGQTYDTAGNSVRAQIIKMKDEILPYIDCSEYLRVYTDSDEYLLWGIKKDGDIFFGKGVPYQVQDMYGKYESGEEFLKVYSDADGYVICGIRKDGDIYFGKGVPSQVQDMYGTMVEENPEFIRAYTDKDGYVIWGLRTDGSVYTCYGIADDVKEEIDRLDYSIAQLSENNQSGMEELDDKISQLSEATQTALDELGTYADNDNPEFIRLYTDSEGYALWGIKNNGNIYFGKGVPEQIQEVYGTIKENPEFLRTYTDEDGYVLTAIKKDGDVFFGKGVPEQIENVYGALEEENHEFIQAYTDQDGYVLTGIKKDGDVFFGKGVPKQIENVYGTLEENPEFIQAYTDQNGYVLGGIKKDGHFVFDNIDYTENNVSDLIVCLNNRGYLDQKENVLDWSNASFLQIPKPDCAVINFTNINNIPQAKGVDYPGIMEFWDMNGNYFKKKAIMNAQGNSSLGYPKKNIAIDICNDNWIGDDTFGLTIGNWVEQDSFHLKAYYTDFFRGVAVGGYSLMNDIVLTRGALEDRPWKKALVTEDIIRPDGFNSTSDLSLRYDDGARCFPDGFPVIVHLNGEFYGVYSFQLKKSRQNMHMSKSNTKHIHLDGVLDSATLFNGTIDWTQFEVRNPKNLYTMNGSKYDGDHPQELIDSSSDEYLTGDSKTVANKANTAKVKQYIINFSGIMNNIKDLYNTYNTNKTDENLEVFKTEFEKYFDVDNLIDYLIFSDVSQNSDGFRKNWQWTTYDGVKWWVNAYDLDCIYGAIWTGDYITDLRSSHLGVSMLYPVYYITTIYNEELEKRYGYYRNTGIIDSKGIINKLNTWTQKIGVEAFKKEYNKWSNTPCNGVSIVNTDYWELIKDENDNPIRGNSNTYNSSTSYSIGNTVYYGKSNYTGYLQYECIQACTGQTPIKTQKFRDSFFRFCDWIKQNITKVDTMYHYEGE